jgi:hypothetical protein
VSFGIEPPKSQIPKISDGTLVALDEFEKNFPDIPNIIMPKSFYHPYRLDMGPRWEVYGIADNAPPKTGKPYVCLVPQVDKDGNEMAGVRLPEVDVPLATFTGWVMRRPSFSNSSTRNSGRSYPFPQTPEVQKQTSDPRESIIARYPTKKDYLFRVTKSVLHLKNQRLLLDEDVTRLLMEAAQQDYWRTMEVTSRVTIKKIAAEPAVVKVGGKYLLSVEFEGLQNHVFVVRTSVREANHLSYVLNDEGNNGDDEAGDNVWSCTAEVQADAPAGHYHLDFHCMDIDLNHVYVKGTAKEGAGEEGSVIVTVNR